MAITVKLKHLRIAPRKVRLVAKMIRKKTVEQAENQLKFGVKEAALPIQKLLHSAVATAENDFGKEKNNLFIKEIKIDEGVTLKRARPRARGRVYRILKRSSHITLVLDEIQSGKKPAPGQKGKVIKKDKEAAVVEENKESARKEPIPSSEKEIKGKPESSRADQARRGARIKAEKTKSRSSLKRIFRRKSF